jgi:parvulin-like peptidyl-prolyl isomerase
MNQAHFSMRGRNLLLLPVLLVAVIAAGCGGSSAKLQSDDVAIVGNTHIKKTMVNELMDEAKANMKASNTKFPAAGTTQYSTIQSQAITLLVQDAEKDIEAAKLGIKVTTKDINARLTQVKKQYFGGSTKTYLSQLKAQGLTDQEVRDQIKSQLRDEDLVNKLTANVTVTPTAVLAYYIQHQSTYQTAASRAVRYILVGKKKDALAASLYSQLKGAGESTWCTLAAKYSLDTTTSAKCGKATFTKGQTVAAFDKLLFSLKTNEVAKVNTSQYGWFVLEPTAATKAAKTKAEKTVAPQIQQTLITNKKNSIMTAWIDKITKTYCQGSKIQYQVGFTPSPDPCAQYTTSSTTTTP